MKASTDAQRRLKPPMRGGLANQQIKSSIVAGLKTQTSAARVHHL